MIVRLLEPVHVAGDVVRFGSTIGAGIGRWRGRTLPSAAADVDVELETDDVIPWSTAEVSTAPPTLQPHPGGGTLVRGTAIALGEDGVLVLQLGASIVQIEMEGQAPADILGRSVAVVLPVLDLYPTGI